MTFTVNPLLAKEPNSYLQNSKKLPWSIKLISLMQIPILANEQMTEKKNLVIQTLICSFQVQLKEYSNFSS